MKLHRTSAMFLRHIYLYRHSLTRLVEIFYWPLLDLLAWVFYSFNLFIIGIYLLPFMLCLVILGWAIGILSTSMILRGSGSRLKSWTGEWLSYFSRFPPSFTRSRFCLNSCRSRILPMAVKKISMGAHTPYCLSFFKIILYSFF